MKIGVPVASLSSTIPSNCIALEGQEVSKTTYSQLFAIYGTTYGTPTDKSKFTLPDFRGRVPWGTEDGTFGTLAAGLPNVAANTTNIFRTYGAGEIASQAIYTIAGPALGFGAGEEGEPSSYVAIDLSKSNSTYGNSDTVRPPSVKVRWYTRYQ